MNSGLIYILLVFGMISWGESWISAKVLTRFAAPEVLVFWRFFFTWVTFIPVMIYMKQSLRISLKGLAVAVAGASLLVVYNELFFTGLIHGLAGAGGILVTTLIPMLTFTIGCFLALKAPTGKDFLGLLLGGIGAAVIMQVWHMDLNLLFKSGNAYFLFAALTWAALTHLSNKSKNYLSAYTYSFYLFFLTSLFEMVLVYSKGMSLAVPMDGLFISNIILIAVGATTFGTTVYFIATSTLGSQKASSFIFLVPLNALLMSWFFLGEEITANTVIGGLAAISAVYLINYKRKVKPA